MHSEPHLNDVLAAPAQRGRAAVAAIVVFLLLWTLALYGRTTASMVAIWERSETFAHGFLIVPLFLYLLWRERESLAAIEPKPFLPALLGIAGVGVIWLIAARLQVNSAAQFAMIAMIPFAVWTVLGTTALKVLGFPLFFLFFAVPIGEFLMPVLMEWTADVTVGAIRASGIPVYREDNHFFIPTGKWSVIEACSGLRYLIASFMVGCLFAYLSFRSVGRRLVFIAASILVPIVANWVRAYGIVMLGHLSGNQIAAGADHLLYGWVFFGVVMGILFWIGARWREDGEQRPARDPKPVFGDSPWQRPRVRGALLAVLAVTLIWPVLDWRSEGGVAVAQRSALNAVAGNGGWVATREALSDWRPDIAGATAVLSQTFEKDGTQVGLFVAYFDGRAQEAKAITSTNQLVSTSNKQWMQVARGTASVASGVAELTVRTAVVAREGKRLAVWQWYWVDGRETASNLVAKLYEVLALVQGHGTPAAWVILYTPTERGEEQVTLTLNAFATAMRSGIDTMLHQATGP
jgi:exosortase A